MEKWKLIKIMKSSRHSRKRLPRLDLAFNLTKRSTWNSLKGEERHPVGVEVRVDLPERGVRDREAVRVEVARIESI